MSLHWRHCPYVERFPKAETEVTLMALCWSLNAALTRCDWSDLDRVIEERLGNTHLAPEERICWLTAGLLVAPERYREDLPNSGSRRHLVPEVAVGVRRP